MSLNPDRLFTASAIILSTAILALFLLNPESKYINSLALATASLIWLLPLAISYYLNHSLIIPFLLAIAIRLTWLFTVHPIPSSDYLRFYLMSKHIAHPDKFPFPFPTTEIPHQPLTSTFLALLLRIFSPAYPGLFAQICLIMIQALTGLLIGLTLKPLDKRSALLASYIWATYPADIFFSGTIGSDVPAAFLSSLILYLSVRWYLNPKPAYLLLTGMLLTISPMFRKAMLFLVPPVILIPALKKHKLLTNYLALLSGPVIAILLAIVYSSILTRSFPPPTHYWWGYLKISTLLTGTNYKFKGMYNPHDGKLYYDIWYKSNLSPAQKINVLTDTIIARLNYIFSDESRALTFILNKQTIFWTGNYAFYWTVVYPAQQLQNMDTLMLSVIKDFATNINTITQLSHSILKPAIADFFHDLEFASRTLLWTLIIATLVGIAITPPLVIKFNSLTALFSLVVITLSAAHIFFEVQGRYHHMILPFLVVISGLIPATLKQNFP